MDALSRSLYTSSRKLRAVILGLSKTFVGNGHLIDVFQSIYLSR